jgi:hypothetical protein
MKDKARKPTTTPGSEPPPAEAVELPERWSVQRKTELILWLLRGEALDVSADGRSPESAEIGSPPTTSENVPSPMAKSGGGTACWDWRTS